MVFNTIYRCTLVYTLVLSSLDQGSATPDPDITNNSHFDRNSSLYKDYGNNINLYDPENIEGLKRNSVRKIPPHPPPERERGSCSESSENEEDAKNLHILDINNKISDRFVKYNRDCVKNLDEFIANHPFLIRKVISNEEVIWEPRGTNYANKITVGDEIEGIRDLQIYFPSKNKKFVDSDNESRGGSVHRDREPTSRPPPKPYVHPQPIKRAALTQREFNDLSPDYRKLSNKNLDIHRQLIGLNIMNRETNKHFIYKVDPETRRMKFTCQPEYLIYRVTMEDMLVTECKNDNYFDRVIIYKDRAGERKLRCLFPGDIDYGDPEEPLPRYTFSKVPLPPPESLKPSKPVPESKFITIDVKVKESTDEIDYHYDPLTKTHTFTPKHSHLINVVNRGNKNVYTYESGHFPEKVVVYPGPDGRPKLRVEFPRYIGRELHEGALPPKYDEVQPQYLKVKPQELVPPESPRKGSVQMSGYKSPVKLEKPRLKLSRGQSSLDVNIYKIVNFDIQSFIDTDLCRIIKLNNGVQYVFNNGFKCAEITFGNRVVWQSGDDDIVYPEYVTYNIKEHKIKLRESAAEVIYKEFSDRSWRHFVSVVNIEQPCIYEDVTPTATNEREILIE